MAETLYIKCRECQEFIIQSEAPYHNRRCKRNRKSEEITLHSLDFQNTHQNEYREAVTSKESTRPRRNYHPREPRKNYPPRRSSNSHRPTNVEVDTRRSRPRSSSDRHNRRNETERYQTINIDSTNEQGPYEYRLSENRNSRRYENRNKNSYRKYEYVVKNDRSKVRKSDEQEIVDPEALSEQFLQMAIIQSMSDVTLPNDGIPRNLSEEDSLEIAIRESAKEFKEQQRKQKRSRNERQRSERIDKELYSDSVTFGYEALENSDSVRFGNEDLELERIRLEQEELEQIRMEQLEIERLEMEQLEIERLQRQQELELERQDRERLIREQDLAFQESLRIDEEKVRIGLEPNNNQNPQIMEEITKPQHQQPVTEKMPIPQEPNPNTPNCITLRISFPNGQAITRRFLNTNSFQTVKEVIQSLASEGSYSLPLDFIFVVDFPRKEFRDMSVVLGDADLGSRVSLRIQSL